MLHVWLRAQSSPLAVWHADTEQWQTIEGWQQLQDIYGSYKSTSNQTLCLYFPSSHVLQIETMLTSSQLKQLGITGKQYLFEEMSIAPVEQLVIRQLSYADYAKSHCLYALAQSDIDVWQQSAILAGFTISAMLPDFLLLPSPTAAASQQVVLYQDQYTTLLRQSEHLGLSVSYLPLMFERMPQLNEICILPAMQPANDSSDLSSDSHTDTQIAEQSLALIAEQQILSSPLLAIPKPVQMPERDALNFFAKTSHSTLSPYLRVAIMVAIAALVLQIATDGVQAYRYNAAATMTQNAIATQYQSWFPEEPLNARLKLKTQMQPKLRNDNQASTPHLAVLARITPLIKQSSLYAQALQMQPTTLSFTLIAPDRDSLDQFTSALIAQGLVANLERVNGTEQGAFSGQITVTVDNIDNDANQSVAIGS